MPKNNIVVAQFSQLSDCEYELMVPGRSTEKRRLFLLNTEERASVIQQLASPTTKPEPLVRVEMPLYTARLVKAVLLHTRDSDELYALMRALDDAGVQAYYGSSTALPNATGIVRFDK